MEEEEVGRDIDLRSRPGLGKGWGSQVATWIFDVAT